VKDRSLGAGNLSLQAFPDIPAVTAKYNLDRRIVCQIVTCASPGSKQALPQNFPQGLEWAA
jgi:hypothetical protein